MGTLTHQHVHTGWGRGCGSEHALQGCSGLEEGWLIWMENLVDAQEGLMKEGAR